MSQDSIQPYREAASEFGGGFEATLWGSPRTQALRFEVLAEMLGGHLCAARTLLDLGCGDGAFTAWLREQRQSCAVTGLDGLPEMVDAATARGDALAQYAVCDLLGDGAWGVEDSFDIVVLSGTLNTMDAAAAMRLLERAWHRCAGAMAFNFLGDQPGLAWMDKPLGPALRHVVADMEAWARERSDHVELRSDYLDGHDVSIRLLHDAPKPQS